MSEQISTYQPSDCTHGLRNKESDNGIGALFRNYGERYISTYRPDLQRIKLIRSIRICKTPFLGGKLYRCTGCESERYVYFSCGHSQCPKCQGLKRLQWQEKLRMRLLNVPYQHIVFTMPHQLNGIARSHPKVMYNILFRSMWDTLKEVCAQKDNVGAKPGVIAVIHTFGSDLKYHVHLHCLVTFGGMDEDGKWQWPKRKDKLAPYRLIRKTYQKSFETKLEAEYANLDTKISWKDLKEELSRKQWCVHCRPPTTDTKIIEEYLSRYINRIGISKSKFDYDQTDEQVRITFNDYKNQKEDQAAPKKQLTLQPLIAIDQILKHVLPPYFQKCRYYGLHAPATAKKLKKHLEKAVSNNGKTIRTLMQIIKALSGIPGFPCEECGGLVWTEEIIRADKEWISNYLVIPNQRGDPTKQHYITTNIAFSSFEKQNFYAPVEGKSPNISKFHREKTQD